MRSAHTRAWGRARRHSLLAVVAAALLGLTACSVSGTPESGPTIGAFVTGVTAGSDSSGSSSNAKEVAATLGTGDSGGPTLTVPQERTAVNGGSLSQGIEASRDVTKIRIALEARHNGRATGKPGRGYTEVSLESASSEVSVVMSLARHLPSKSFSFFFAGVDASGKQGALARQEVTAQEVGSGAVQVTASWDVDSDLDLILVEPDGNKVYYNAKTSPSGAKLDLDSNSDCTLDHVRNENIYYENQAPPGTYTVYVNLYKACSTPKTDYAVTVNQGGQQSTYTGSFNAADAQQSADPSVLREVTTFQVGAAP
ncbi:MAG: hypothetical protein QM662_13690 [Gordonia sp. (in: high G+C Gram-positive bacteria)]